MLTDEQRKDVARFTGKRFAVKYVIRTLRLSEPKSPDYQNVYNEVAALVNRDLEIAIRVTSAELEELKSRASKTGHTRMAEYIRVAALGATITTPPPVHMTKGNQTDIDLASIRRDLNRIAHNLNQAVLKLNVQDKHHGVDDATVAQYRAEIERLFADLKAVEVPRHDR